MAKLRWLLCIQETGGLCGVSSVPSYDTQILQIPAASLTFIFTDTAILCPVGTEPPTSAEIQEKMGSHHSGAGGGRFRALSQTGWGGKDILWPLWAVSPFWMEEWGLDSCWHLLIISLGKTQNHTLFIEWILAAALLCACLTYNQAAKTSRQDTG